MSHPLVAAVEPLTLRIGATVVPLGEHEPGDVPLAWDGVVIGYVRLPRPSLDEAVRLIIADVAARFDRPLTELGMAERRAAVRLLNDRGAFGVRKSVQLVAGALGVSRFTVYNYLHETDD